MYKRSLISTGNNFRMKKAMEKAENGERVTIAYLGGSITEGYNGGPNNCFAKLTCDYFAQTFCKGNNVRYINAGMAGTPSTIGLIRVERDLLIHKPDIVYIEFAVNDTKDTTNMAVFESLLLRILNSESQPALVLIFTVSEAGFSCQNEMTQIGSHYELPMISVKDVIIPEFDEGRMRWQDYSDDYIHPHEKGHELITKLIIYYLEKVSKEDIDSVYKILQTPIVGNEFVNLKMLDNTNLQVKDSGGFFPDSTINQFPRGWTHKAGTAKGRFTFDLHCKNLFIVYKESKNTDTGSADVYVDGVCVFTANGFNSSGWNNPVVKLLLNTENSAIHKIEIKMSKGFEDKEFSILAFGYS
ncbi:SGNH/GDSL hydrolase family protein [Clostridium sp. BNL1100]|uniref:SGNH/GDSL hydrolase family protein n=1 Tax=Clostridium sp. BNL1100 TaxID=755731 RepID=UPI00024A76E3|nr:SGNH/GDSL hydrolase family protein [Clostridium sp. BNL1100]AEY66042.1 lysophospholipase L1-like esterase [Clostridium sp. BNL1100]